MCTLRPQHENLFTSLNKAPRNELLWSLIYEKIPIRAKKDEREASETSLSESIKWNFKHDSMKSQSAFLIQREILFSTFYRKKSTFLPCHVKKNHSTLEVDTFKVMLLLDIEITISKGRFIEEYRRWGSFKCTSRTRIWKEKFLKLLYVLVYTF